MKKLGIKYQILLITLIPVFLIDLFFTYTQVNSGIAQANELLQSKSQIIARQIAGASEYNLFSGNDSQIQYLLEQTVGSDDIVLASVYDRQGRLIAKSLSDEYEPEEAFEYLYHRQPILSLSIEHSDIFTPDLSDDRQTDNLGWVHLYVSRRQLEERAQQIIVEAIAFFIAILIMAFLLIATISGRITRPIFALMEHLKLVETGELGKIIEPVADNEIGAVQEGFNRMTRSLLANRRHLNRRIEQATRQLNEAITDLESKNRELGFARDQAQDANRTKSEFLANMSHEIRTPINGIKGFIHLLGQSQLDHVQQRYADIIEKSTDDLTNIVNEILDFSKMESGKLHIVEEPFDLYEVIEQTRDILFINVLTKNIDLNLVLFSDTPRWLIGDKLRLKQILLNLIGNAIKFTDQGRVLIRVCLLDEHDDSVEIEIAVEDTGIGISDEDQQNLFQAFSQVESSDTRRFSGTGLGLVISKNLATLMGGDIAMQSQPGTGSTFRLNLPFRRAPRADDEDAPRQSDCRALVFAAEQYCLMETRTLLERAGVAVESELVDNQAGNDPVFEAILRSRAFIDLLVFDLRHLELDLERLVHPDTTAGTRTLVMDYDRGFGLAPELQNVEFASVVSTSQSIAELVARRIPSPPDDPADDPGPAEPKRVLLVDDNPVNLTLAGELIRLWGHEVTEASDGKQALEIFSRQPFDLIILDIQMPDIDGVSLLGMMRKRAPEDRTPIAALTANVLNDEAGRLLDLGFDYFLSKPIEEDRFRSLLDGDPQRRDPGNDSTAAEDNDADCTVDYKNSLALCAGNESLLRQIFEIIRRDIPEHCEQLEEALRRDQRDRLAAIAHKLHGVTCYASLPRLRRAVLDFQQRLGPNSDAPLDSQVRELLRELDLIAGEIEGHLQEMDAAEKSA